MNLKNAGVFLGSQNKHWIEGGFRILREICVCFFWGGGGSDFPMDLSSCIFFWGLDAAWLNEGRCRPPPKQLKQPRTYSFSGSNLWVPMTLICHRVLFTLTDIVLHVEVGADIDNL